MKDSCHHIRSIQKKIIQEARKESQNLSGYSDTIISNSHVNGKLVDNSVVDKKFKMKANPQPRLRYS